MPGKIKVLLIDDEKEFNHFVKLNLENTGEFEVLATEDPIVGIDLARRNPPDLILLDIYMPKLDGTAVAENLLADNLTSNIPIVFLTALVKQGELNKNSTIAGRHYIAKPVTTGDLISQIKVILKK
ncbi:MAG: response regulator [Candidatus Omnitrophica bacterium]|nr:response regulator [Candidatus Omnitrophota bacterium]MDD5027276.1 response regulator [Candidatus Omnitrophota bacterium]MDD5662372.1 response regulator [Candidatus Omnitrophota bacterium]